MSTMVPSWLVAQGLSDIHGGERGLRDPRTSLSSISPKLSIPATQPLFPRQVQSRLPLCQHRRGRRPKIPPPQIPVPELHGESPLSCLTWDRLCHRKDSLRPPSLTTSFTLTMPGCLVTSAKPLPEKLQRKCYFDPIEI